MTEALAPGIASVLALGATVGEARRALAQVFRAADLDTPELDARILVGYVLGLDHAALAAVPERVLAADERALVAAAAARRLAREPVARIVGRREFWGLSLDIGPAVLVPRPETETLVEEALDRLGTARRHHHLRIVDVGTGSGAVLLALLHELPNARGVGTDLSPQALSIARGNAARLGLASRAGFVCCDLAAALGAGGADLVVSNPPYVAIDDIPTLAPEVRQYDPILALDGGPDGLAAYRRIAADAPRLLAPGGALVMEMGHDQDEQVRTILVRAGLTFVGAARRDLSGSPRVVSACYP